MRLTVYTDYSLRVLLYAGLHPERLVSTQEISRSYRISHHHLVKVVNHLGSAGFLEIHRGRKGGFRLGREPEAIRIGDVVRQTEPDFNLVECFNPEANVCPITPACRLKNALERAKAAFMGVLDELTLADMLGPRRGAAYLKHLLSSPEEATGEPDLPNVSEKTESLRG